MLNLIPPSLDLYPAYMDFIHDMQSSGETIWHTMIPSPSESPEQFITRLITQTNESTYWALLSNQIIGRIALRHTLTDDLKIFGGNIGYEVRPGFRKQGHATEMLRLILQTPKAKELKRVLLTCAPNNIGSNKTILSNGGVLEKTVYVEKINRDTNYYWITIP